MNIRIAATIVLIIGAGAVLGGTEPIARSGGGHAGGAPAASPPAARAGAIRPFLHAGRGAVGSRTGMRSHPLRASFFRHRRFGFGSLTTWGGWYDPYYGQSYSQPYYDPLSHSIPDEAPYPAAGYPAPPYLGTHSSTVAQRAIYVIPYRPGCDSQTQHLPWRDGSERSVTIVRC